MIICAAMKVKFINSKDEIVKLIIYGRRHKDCFNTMEHLDSKYAKYGEEGFINHKGEFLDRKEALKHAQECGQLTQTTLWYKEDHGDDELYSEDLY